MVYINSNPNYYKCDYIECREPFINYPYYSGGLYFCSFAHNVCYDALRAGDFAKERHWAQKGHHAHMACLEADRFLGRNSVPIARTYWD